jgi:hypothetical protein
MADAGDNTGRGAANRREYNTGDEKDRRHALDGITDFTKLLITLATGTIVLSATFLEKFYKGHSLALLIAAWSTIALSVILGVLALGQAISQFSESDIRPRRSAVEVLNLLQFLAFLAGIVMFSIFAVNNVAN